MRPNLANSKDKPVIADLIPPGGTAQALDQNPEAIKPMVKTLAALNKRHRVYWDQNKTELDNEVLALPLNGTSDTGIALDILPTLDLSGSKPPNFGVQPQPLTQRECSLIAALDKLNVLTNKRSMLPALVNTLTQIDTRSSGTRSARFTDPDICKKRGRAENLRAQAIAHILANAYYHLTGKRSTVGWVSPDGLSAVSYGSFLVFVTDVFQALGLTQKPESYARKAQKAFVQPAYSTARRKSTRLPKQPHQASKSSHLNGLWNPKFKGSQTGEAN